MAQLLDEWKPLLIQAVQTGASDLFLVAGAPVSVRLQKKVSPLQRTVLTANDTYRMAAGLYSLAGRDISFFQHDGDDDFSFCLENVAYFRANAYRQQDSVALSIRIIPMEMPGAEALGIPDPVMELAKLQSGLVLLTGPAGSGKSTTLACLIEAINQNRAAKIITLEDPIEYRFRNSRSIISQREIGKDAVSFSAALRSSLRQSPDVLCLGEMRDEESLRAAITAAETGALVFSTLHTLGAANAINRILDVFPPEKQLQIRLQLAMITRAIVSQQLLPAINGRVIPAFELLQMNPAAKSIINDARLLQLNNVISSHKDSGMCLMDDSILHLYEEGEISGQTAMQFALDPPRMSRRICTNCTCERFVFDGWQLLQVRDGRQSSRQNVQNPCYAE